MTEPQETYSLPSTDFKETYPLPPISSQYFTFDPDMCTGSKAPDAPVEPMGGYTLSKAHGEELWLLIQRLVKKYAYRKIDIVDAKDHVHYFAWSNYPEERKLLDRLLAYAESEYNKGGEVIQPRSPVRPERPQINSEGQISLDPEKHILVKEPLSKTTRYSWENLNQLGDYFIITHHTLAQVSANAAYQMKKYPGRMIKCHKTPDGIFVTLAYDGFRRD